MRFKARNLPVRGSLLRACYPVPEGVPRTKRPALTEQQKMAAYVKWLDMFERLPYRQIAERLGVDYDFVYGILERGNHSKVQEQVPP